MNYAIGFLENVGTFYVKQHKQGHYSYEIPEYIVACDDMKKAYVIDEVFELIKTRLGIDYKRYEENNKKRIIWKINIKSGLEKFLSFVDRNFKLEKTNQKEVRNVLQQRIANQCNSILAR